MMKSVIQHDKCVNEQLYTFLLAVLVASWFCNNVVF